MESPNDYTFDCEAVFTVHIAADSPRAANELFKQFAANVEIVADDELRRLNPAFTSASVQVQDSPVFAYGYTPGGEEIDEDGLPPEAVDWHTLLSAAGTAAYIAALALANWEENTDADRADKLATIRDIVDRALAPLLPAAAETSPDGAGA